MSPLLILLVLSAFSPRLPGEERVDPHKEPSACGECHVVSDEGVGAAKPIIETCLDCHPDGDMHPVHVDVGEIRVPERFPTAEDGTLTCWTCHVDPMCTAGQKVPEPYLRDGPYKYVNSLCFGCHERGEYERTNPHHPDVDRVMDSDYCSACHTGRPEVGAKPEEARLREVAGGVCMTCHDPFPHQGSTAHVGVKLESEVIAQLPPQLAVPADGTVQCWTCHEVHDRPPVADPRWLKETRLASAVTELVLARMAEKEELSWNPQTTHGPNADHHPMLALPDDDGALCRACHIPERAK
jgi:hypothetical protein